MGERIIVVGRVLDEDERPVPNTLIEIWQANAAGRYHHPVDQHNAPLDPNFTGAGRCVTNENGEYRYLTIKPGAYPWLNHTNAWRPAHIHLSLFGPSFVTRLVTQFFFPGDPLIPLDPIFNSVPTKSGRERLMSSYAHDVTEPDSRWVIASTSFCADVKRRLRGTAMKKQTPSQTVGPFYCHRSDAQADERHGDGSTQGQRIRIEGQVFDGDGAAIPDVMVEIWQANAYGRYNHPDDKQEKPLDPTFTGWGRSGTDEKCFYSFETIKPGPVPGSDDSVQAPHINVVVFARGMLVHAYTRLYFADEPANASDPVLNSIKNKKRRETLIALPGMENGKPVYRFDIRLQGENETVFFDM